MSEERTQWISSLVVRTDTLNVAALPDRDEFGMAQSTIFMLMLTTIVKCTKACQLAGMLLTGRRQTAHHKSLT